MNPSVPCVWTGNTLYVHLKTIWIAKIKNENLRNNPDDLGKGDWESQIL